MPLELPATINQIRHAGLRPPLSLTQIDQMLESQNLVQRLSEAAAVGSQSASLPQWWRPASISASKREVRTTGDTKARAPSIVHITEYARIVTSESELPEQEFVSCLQIIYQGEWATVVCYEFRRRQSRRYMYYCNGQIKPFEMDLPACVVVEMAKEDFQRNWMMYSTEFSRQSVIIRDR